MYLEGVQPHPGDGLHQVWMAEACDETGKSFDLSVLECEPQHPKAAACLEKGRGGLLAFGDFPAEPWKHLRMINPTGSTIATVRSRTEGGELRAACRSWSSSSLIPPSASRGNPGGTSSSVMSSGGSDGWAAPQSPRSLHQV